MFFPVFEPFEQRDALFTRITNWGMLSETAVPSMAVGSEAVGGGPEVLDCGVLRLPLALLLLLDMALVTVNQ